MILKRSDKIESLKENYKINKYLKLKKKTVIQLNI